MENLIIKPNRAKALFLAKRQLAELIYDAVNLEGILYTLPEVQTLLQGITVGGHALTDEKITLNQSAAWKRLFQLVEKNQFEVTKTIACELHAIAACEESLTWGKFRTGGVTIAGSAYMPPASTELDTCWEKMVMEAATKKDMYDKAIFVFLQMARNQFFYDVNKRMGRFLMNGILLTAGYPVINLPAKKQLEFNQLMLDYYTSGDVALMTQFMKNCLEEKTIIIMNEDH